VPNKAHRNLREMLDTHVPDDGLWKRWKRFLDHEDPHIALRAFEMALHYRFGKPVQTLVGEENAPAIKIDVSAIPQFRESA
jgi:hypothetical protein